jgi:hypothetical protein
MTRRLPTNAEEVTHIPARMSNMYVGGILAGAGSTALIDF